VADAATERVLVIPTAVLRERAGPAGLFQGFTPEVGRYLPWLLDPAHLSYLPRDRAENDPAYKQLIPYVVLRCAGRLFHYTRGRAGNEARLRSLRSVGVGGHISPGDGTLPPDAYRAGMWRELEEEVILESPYSERTLGLINDDSTPVGRVHLGVVHLLDLREPRVRRREEALADCGFAPLGELRGQRQAFETWSQFLLEGPWLAQAHPSHPGGRPALSPYVPGPAGPVPLSPTATCPRSGTGRFIPLQGR
jgi:predicted NUDIX family phosphoesterase